jgi:hypothetical protein
MNNGPGRRDAACNYSGTDPFFSSGNERTPSVYSSPDGKMKTGYYIRRADTFSLYSELMNLDEQAKQVWVTMTYEYIPSHPLDYAETKAVWLGIGQCLKPPVPSIDGKPYPVDKQGRPFDTKPFDVNSPAWWSPWNGIKLSVGGHLHDGGTSIFIYENENVLCTSKASYGTSPQFIEKSTGLQGNPGMRHISHMSGCTMMGPLKKGTRYYLTARYNFDKHPTMLNNKGKPDEIMAISLLYISVPFGTT